jgi:hypothetical protein
MDWKALSETATFQLCQKLEIPVKYYEPSSCRKDHPR